MSASTNEAPAAGPSDSPSVASPESTPRQLDPATCTPPAAAFEMLGAGEAKPGHDGDHLDFSGATTEELALYEAFNTAIVPTNSSHLYELPADPTPAVWHATQRLHGYLAPAEFENAFYADTNDRNLLVGIK